MGKSERTTGYVHITSPINPALLSDIQRGQLLPRPAEVPFAQILGNCRTMDKDATQAAVDEILIEIDRIYRLGGLAKKDRISKIAQHESAIQEASPAKQPMILEQYRKQFSLSGK